MLKAAVEGTIDFSTANFHDRLWYLRLDLVLHEMTDRTTLEYLRVSQIRHLTYMTIPNIETKHWEDHRDAEHSTYEDYIRLLLGEYDDDKEDRQTRINRALTSAWANEFGDPDDPQTQLRIEAAAFQLSMQRKQGG